MSSFAPVSIGASVIAKLGFGALSDYVSPWILALFIFTCTSVATFVLWGVTGHVVAGVLVFGVVYGILAGGWFAIWGAFVKGITSKFSPISLKNANPDGLLFVEDNPSASMTLMGMLMLSSQYCPPL